jgi:hypothetical protein
MCLVGVSLNSIPYAILYLSRSISPSPTQFAQSKPVRPIQTSSPNPNQFAQPNPERTPRWG